MGLTPFTPYPFLGNPHLQTLLGAFWPGRGCPSPQRRHVVRLPDGDALLLHENTPPRWRPRAPIALLVHGLTGCHRSSHIRRLAARFLDRGARTFRIDQRGAGDGVLLARKTYHSGRSEDVRHALEHVHALSPESPLLLLGVSLGGNVALKLAGEAAERPVPGLARVAAVAPPIDLERCSALICQPSNRLYEQRFVGALVRDVRRRERFFGHPPIDLPRRLTLRGFDDLYTAPRNGFADAADYYRQASSFPLIARIAVPTLVLTARDDPFIAVEPFEELRAPAHVEVHIADRGGHVGFVGWGGRWAERWLVDWLLEPRRGAAQ
jgi:predicted alpha/beta-fold hydrolase